MVWRLGATIVAAVAVFASACAGAGDAPSTSAPAPTASEPASTDKLVIAVQPTNTPDQLSADAKDLERFLAERLGRPVEIVFPTTYAGVIEALRFGHADAAFMSAWPLALAQRRAGSDVVLAEIREVVIGSEKQERPYYFSYWVVRPDSPYQRLEDLRGKKVAFPSQLSTSGYVAPLARALELGMVTKPAANREADPRSFFGEVVFSGGYAQGWEALKAGQVDATIIAGDVSESLYRDVLANTRVIEQQGPIPSHGVAVAKSLSAGERERLVSALMALNDPQYRPLMRTFVSGIFVRFEATTQETHLASLNGFLQSTQLEFVERLR